MGLTQDQQVDTRMAHAALEASRASEPADYLSHVGPLEYHLGRLLEVIAELTGDRC